MGVLIFLAGCEKEEAFQSNHDGYIFKKGQRSSRILEFGSPEEFMATVADLEAGVNTFLPDDDEECYFRPDLDNYEQQQSDFRSLRKKYEDLNCEIFKAHDGFPEGEPLHACPIIDEEGATLFNEDGLVIIGDRIHAVYNPAIQLIAPSNQLQAIETVRGQSSIPYSNRLYPKEVMEDIEFYTKAADCEPEFTVQVNNSTGNVYLTIVEDAIQLSDGETGHYYWDLPNSSNQHYNQQSVQFSANPNIALYDVCLTFIATAETEMEQDQNVETVEVCANTICQTIEVGDCIADFDYTIGLDGVVNFVNVSSVAYGEITSVEWIFGDGSTSTEALPTHVYPCNKKYDVTLVIYSEDCPNGSMSITRKVDLNSLVCCDKNAHLGSLFNWSTETFSNEQRIKYRYAMGSLIPFDQRFIAAIWYQEKNNNGKWRTRKADLFVDFEGSLYDSDENGCQCSVPSNLQENPDAPVHRRIKTFKDALDGLSGLGNWSQMKLQDSPILHYEVDGQVVLSYVCTDSPGFQCEN